MWRRVLFNGQMESVAVLLVGVLLLAACSGPGAGEAARVTSGHDGAEGEMVDEHPHEEEHELPALTPVDLAGERLRVVASTNIVADVVAQVGAEHIDLHGLIPIGADPHSFEPTPQDLIVLNEAHVIFINGLHLEEALDPILAALDGGAPVVAVNVGVETMTLDDAAEGHDHGDTDPHTWFSVRAVEQWVENIEHVLGTLDPANSPVYATQAEAYRSELAGLEAELIEQMAQIPPERRKVVTDHDSLGYFAAAYGVDVVGTVIPSLSTLAAPSARELARLHDQIQAEGVQAILVGTTMNPEVAQQLATDTGVAVATIYTGSLSEPGGPAANYLDFMRYNTMTIVKALHENANNR